MRKLIAWDTEGYRFLDGLLAPPIVCHTFADASSESIMLRDEGLDAVENLLDDDNIEITTANGVYDFACAAAARPHLLPKIFNAYEKGRIWCVLIGESLIDLYDGMLFVDRKIFKPFERYSLARLVMYHYGKDISNKKYGPDIWRLRYAELDGVPLEQWPIEAKEYAIEDARYTYDITMRQKAIGGCGMDPVTGRYGKNLHAMAEQSQAAWALHLSAVWGMRTDPDLVPEVVAEVESLHDEMQAKFREEKFYRDDGVKNTDLIKSRLAAAYGGFYCAECGGDKTVKQGKGKKAVMVTCPSCNGRESELEGVPTTATGQVQCDKDAMVNSGDELLKEFSEAGANEKIYSTYVKILWQGVEVPINPSIKVLVNTTRVAYARPNLTNQPRKGKVRECFLPRPGRAL